MSLPQGRHLPCSSITRDVAGGGRVRGSGIHDLHARKGSGRAAGAYRLNYYRGSVNGQLNDDTRNALFQFQVDRVLRGTGNLDGGPRRH